MPNPPTCSPKTNSTNPAAKRKVSPSSAKGQPKVQGRADRPALDPAAAAQDTMLISPTLLAALITRSIAKGFEPIVAELRDIARTSHDTSDRLFGESLKAKAHEQWRASQAKASTETSTDRLQGLMDKLWAQGYRPTSTEPLVCRSFHEFEALINR